jgi:hypothetical protein
MNFAELAMLDVLAAHTCDHSGGLSIPVSEQATGGHEDLGAPYPEEKTLQTPLSAPGGTRRVQTVRGRLQGKTHSCLCLESVFLGCCPLAKPVCAGSPCRARPLDGQVATPRSS